MTKKRTKAKSEAVTRIRRSLGRIQTSAEAYQLARDAEARARELGGREYRKAVRRWWAEEPAHWKGSNQIGAGDLPSVVWCAAEGKFMGGRIQRGTRAVVYHVQPRAKRVWLIVGEDRDPRGFNLGEAYRYRWSRTEPDRPATRSEVESYEKMGKVFEEALSS